MLSPNSHRSEQGRLPSNMRKADLELLLRMIFLKAEEAGIDKLLSMDAGLLSKRAAVLVTLIFAT